MSMSMKLKSLDLVVSIQDCVDLLPGPSEAWLKALRRTLPENGRRHQVLVADQYREIRDGVAGFYSWVKNDLSVAVRGISETTEVRNRQLCITSNALVRTSDEDHRSKLSAKWLNQPGIDAASTVAIVLRDVTNAISRRRSWTAIRLYELFRHH